MRRWTMRRQALGESENASGTRSLRGVHDASTRAVVPRRLAWMAAATLIAFRVRAADAGFLAKPFGAEVPLPADFAGLANHQVYRKLMIGGVRSKPFPAGTIPPATNMRLT
jgi:hypothetical protein